MVTNNDTKYLYPLEEGKYIKIGNKHYLISVFVKDSYAILIDDKDNRTYISFYNRESYWKIMNLIRVNNNEI